MGTVVQLFPDQEERNPFARLDPVPPLKFASSPEQYGETMALCMAKPWPALVDATMDSNKYLAATAIVAFHTRLPHCGIGWDDLTTRQQGRWSELVQSNG